MNELDSAKAANRAKYAESNWDMHHKLKNDAFKAIDQTILVVSTGAFGLSMVLLNFLKTGIHYEGLLLLSWAALLFAIYSSVKTREAIALGSLQNQHLLGTWARSRYTHPYPPDWNMDTSGDPIVKKYSSDSTKWRERANTALAIGIIFLFLFAAFNIGKNSADRQQEEYRTQLMFHI